MLAPVQPGLPPLSLRPATARVCCCWSADATLATKFAANSFLPRRFNCWRLFCRRMAARCSRKLLAFTMPACYAAGTTIEVDIDPPAIALTRFAMDAALFHAAEFAGVTALQQTAVASVQCDARGFIASVSDGTFAAPALIVTAGRWSNLDSAARQGDPARRDFSKLVGVKAHFSDPNGAIASDAVELHFFEGGYCGVQPVAKGIVSACAMVRADVATTLRRSSRKVPRYRHARATGNSFSSPSQHFHSCSERPARKVAASSTPETPLALSIPLSGTAYRWHSTAAAPPPAHLLPYGTVNPM